MSTLCQFCSVVSRNACSDYKRKYIREEIMSCGNLYDDQRVSALRQAGVSTSNDDELEEYRRRYGRL